MNRGAPAGLSRRRFLELAAASATLTALGGFDPAALRHMAAAGAGPPLARSEHPPVDGLDGVMAVGVVYLADHPEEAEVSLLQAALGIGRGADLSAWLGRLPDLVRADFATGQVVSVDGWRFARTEARLAALLHLLA